MGSEGLIVAAEEFELEITEDGALIQSFHPGKSREREYDLDSLFRMTRVEVGQVDSDEGPLVAIRGYDPNGVELFVVIDPVLAKYLTVALVTSLGEML